MVSYNSLGAALVNVAMFYAVLLVICWAVSRLWSRDVTLPEDLLMSRRAQRRELLTMRRCRRRADLLWRFAEHLSGGRRAWVERLSRRYTDQAQQIEEARRTRLQQAERLDAQLRAWAAALTPIPGNSPYSPSPPPSAPRPTLEPAEEDTRRWERTLPWGTPSPLVTREGLGRPYPFVPLAPPLPEGTVYRSPPRQRQPKPVPLPGEPAKQWK